MPMLRRDRTRPLLKTVNGKPHATQDDHADALPSPPKSDPARSSGSRRRPVDTEEDINREPESSDDDNSVPVHLDGPIEFKRPTQDTECEERTTVVSFKKPVSSSPGSAGSKRSSDSDSENEIFSSQRSKRQKTTFVSNIHATARQYGSTAKARSFRKENRGTLKPSRKAEVEKAPLAQFKVASGSGALETGDEAEPATFKPSKSSANDTGERHDLSPSLSSLSDAPDPEDHNADMPDAQPYQPTVECTMCGRSVDKFLKQEFEDEFSAGRRMSYKWQQRFCRFHKQHEARQLWKERGYPEIDWDGLERRMLRYRSHLEGVLSGKKASHYRKELAGQLKGPTKTAVQAVKSDDAKAGAAVGYYGPRGEKAMTDHILTHLSIQLRRQATQDKLVASSGISGGVSGFIQAVLVPELATQLIKDDLHVSEPRAREIAAESAEVGDLLNPELEEKVEKAVEMDYD